MRSIFSWRGGRLTTLWMIRLGRKCNSMQRGIKKYIGKYSVATQITILRNSVTFKGLNNKLNLKDMKNSII